LPFEQVSIESASVFPGFCSNHDKTLFEPIEDHDWTDTDQQRLLIYYRSLCKELYSKYIADAGYAAAIEFAATKDLRKEFKNRRKGNLLSLKEIEAQKKKADSMIRYRAYRPVSYSLELGKDFPIRVAGHFAPEYDANSRRCYDLADYGIPIESVCISTVTVENDVIGCLTYIGNSTVLRRFIQSISDMRDKDRKAMFAQLCFDHCEEVYFSVDWWDSLNGTVSSRIAERFKLNTPGTRTPCDSSLDLAFSFALGIR
jgi:hypothetical protein